MTNEEQNAAGAAQGPQLNIQKIYVKDLSFETPNSPAIFREQWSPEVNLNIGTETENLGSDLYDVTISLTATVKNGDKTAFLVEVKQAGIFGIRGLTDEQLKHTLATYCPNLLFPYARETVSDLVIRGGFPQFLVAPVNFDALYAQHLQEQQAGAQAAEH